MRVEHVQIGNVLGSDGKILRTRSGAPIKLMALLDEAIERAAAVIAETRPELDEATRAEIARHVGIGAVKYADLSVSHDSEYTFDFDRMLSLTGNTGPYLQYAAARIRSILRKAEAPGAAAGEVVLGEEQERPLALALLDFGQVVAQVGARDEPHRLCGYLFDLAQAFTAFYEACPVLRAEDEAVRALPAGAERRHPRGARHRPRPARHHRPRPDVARDGAFGHGDRRDPARSDTAPSGPACSVVATQHHPHDPAR